MIHQKYSYEPPSGLLDPEQTNSYRIPQFQN